MGGWGITVHPHHRHRVSAAVLQAKFDRILPHLDERCRRLYLASEAVTLGHGGITVVAAASGTSTATITRGISELDTHSAPTLRIRAPGAERRPLTVTDTGLLPALEALIEPRTRGDPVSPLRWTTLSLRTLASTLTARGHPVSATTVGHLLHTMGYSLQGTAKTTEGAHHPDRDAQFAHINATAAAFLDEDQPVISVDTKAKEWVATATGPDARCGAMSQIRPREEPANLQQQLFQLVGEVLGALPVSNGQREVQ